MGGGCLCACRSPSFPPQMRFDSFSLLYKVEHPPRLSSQTLECFVVDCFGIFSSFYGITLSDLLIAQAQTHTSLGGAISVSSSTAAKAKRHGLRISRRC